MELVKPGTYIDFMRHRKAVVGVSLLLVATAIVSFFFPGPNYGIDFRGGTELQLVFNGEVDSSEVRTTLESLGYSRPDVVAVEGADNQYIIRVREVSSLSDDEVGSIRDGLGAGLGNLQVADIEASPGGDKVTFGLVPAIETSDLEDALRSANPDVLGVEGDALEYTVSLGGAGTLDRNTVQTTVQQAFDSVGVRDFDMGPAGSSATFQLVAAVATDTLEDALREGGARVRSVSESRAGVGVYEAHLVGVGDEMVRELREALGERGPDAPLRVEWVGPKAGAQLRDAAIKSMLYAIAFIMVYVAFRFDLRFAPGGVLAMAHDVIITIGIYVLVQKEVNLTTVAALLTILGYSINDTIVVYDRIRENMGRLRDRSLFELINISTSQMLSRTIVTSTTTLLSVSAFFLWGTAVIRDIAFALFIGILIGTYSSVYIAAPVTEWMDRKFFSKGRKKSA